MSTVLLKTKLYIPVPRSDLVPRPHLIDRLDEGLSRKLILVAAPAGYGKTTLLSSWVTGCGQRAAWFSIDDGDNDPARFLAYLIAAVQTIKADLGQDILSAVQSSQSSQIADWLPILVNQLDSIVEPFVLSLDDYHLIAAPAIHEALAFLLEHQPSQMHVAITTRKDPPLPLPRLRARGQLTELRQADLRFTTEETAAFLQRGIGVELSTEDAASLVSRTEGWIAGLQMAALSIRDREDAVQLMAAFGGSHEYIVDYFATEVLAHQPEPLRTFLQQTSILARLCGSLCDAVTLQAGGQHTLEQLQQGNLFVAPLDNDHTWYRYHPLFRDLLRKQLQQAQPELLPELHRRASQWCEEHEFVDEAIDYALSGHDGPRLGRLLDAHAEAFFLRGEHATLMRWIVALPDDERRARPALGTLHAILFSAAGKSREAELILREVDQTLSNLGEAAPQNRQLLGRAAAAHAVLATLQDNPQTILLYSRQALDLIPDKDGWRSGVLLASSNAHLLMGDLTACIKSLSEAIDMATAQNSPMLMLAVMPKLAHAYWMQGHLNRAGQVCRNGLHYIDRRSLAHSPLNDNLFITWGAILCEKNDLDRAAEFIARGLESSRSGQVILNQHFGYRSMARVSLAKHDPQAAEEFLRQADALAREYDISIQHTSPMVGLKAQLLIQQGRLAEAENELRMLDAQADEEIPLTHHGRLHLSSAQLHIAQGNFPAAEKKLDLLLRFSHASGQQRWVVPVQILRSMLHLARQDLPQALLALEAAMELAEPEGFIQDFLDEGEPMIQLLREAVHRKVKPEFACQLLGRFLPGHLAEKSIGLVEPLSEREREVLSLVAEGLSNQEIAARLYLSLRTIKFHTGNIYGKLGVKSRTAAVSKARDLGLLTS